MIGEDQGLREAKLLGFSDILLDEYSALSWMINDLTGPWRYDY